MDKMGKIMRGLIRCLCWVPFEYKMMLCRKRKDQALLSWRQNFIPNEADELK